MQILAKLSSLRRSGALLTPRLFCVQWRAVIHVLFFFKLLLSLLSLILQKMLFLEAGDKQFLGPECLPDKETDLHEIWYAYTLWFQVTQYLIFKFLLVI